MAEPIRVLVIDDGEGLANHVARMLRPEHAVTVEPSAARALAMLQGGAEFDAVVCSLGSNELAGDEIHAALRADRPGVVDRLVFVTSGTLSPVTRRFVSSVADRVIVKPFGLSELRDVVHRAPAAAR